MASVSQMVTAIDKQFTVLLELVERCRGLVPSAVHDEIKGFHEEWVLIGASFADLEDPCAYLELDPRAPASFHKLLEVVERHVQDCNTILHNE